MDYLGQSVPNTHYGDVLITDPGNLKVDGDLIVGGTIDISGIEITPPGCLATDCVKEISLNLQYYEQ